MEISEIGILLTGCDVDFSLSRHLSYDPAVVGHLSDYFPVSQFIHPVAADNTQLKSSAN